MVLTVKAIAPGEVAQYWLRCGALIESGLAPSEQEVNASDVLAQLIAGRSVLVAVEDDVGAVVLALVVQLIPFPNYTVAHVLSIGGRRTKDLQEHWGYLKAWMRQQGASKVQGMCQPAQARLWRRFGFTPSYQVVRQDL